jgi:type IV pilus assembly protein PilV
MKSRSRGFTLIEALVALVLLSVGLLGSAAMLLGSMRTHAAALRYAAAANLLRDVADRIRANPLGRAAYDTRASAEPAGCDITVRCVPAGLAALDRAYFERAARAVAPGNASAASIHFEPATGPAPDRFRIALDLGRDPADRDVIVLIVLAQSPVAG